MLKCISTTTLIAVGVGFFLLVMPATSTVAQVAHWSFNEGQGDIAFDLTTPPHNGSILSPTWTTGRFGAALQFDGQDDHVDVGTFDINSSALTIACWIKADSFPGSAQDPRIISKATGTDDQDHYWMLSAIEDGGQTKIRFRLKTTTTTATLIGPQLTTNTWIYIAATYDGQKMRLYKNGALAAYLDKTGQIQTNPSVKVWIGDQPPVAGTRPWHGIIDDLRIYNRALSANEIQQIMNQGEAGQSPIVSISQPTQGQTLSLDSPVAFNVDATDPGGLVGAVQFFVDGIFLHEDLTPPYTYTWQPTEAGSHTLTATAEDHDGYLTTSNPVPVNVGQSSGNPRDIEWVLKSTTSNDLDKPTASGDEQTATLVLDINKDGITDFVITDRSQTPSVVWYESSNQGSWTRHIIDNTNLPIEAGGTYYDIDNDGDLDIVMAGDYQSNEIWWWQNPYPNFSNPWTRRLIKSDGSKKHHDQIFFDIDHDGKTELVFWNQSAQKLMMAEIPANPTTQPWPYTEIYSWSSGPEHEGLALADIDGDGQTDLVGAGRWFKHNGGNSFTANIIDDSQTFGRAAAAQLIPGGHPEVVFGPGDNVNDLAYYTYDGQTWTKHVIKQDIDHGHSLFIADFDRDGLPDIFCAEMRLNNNNPDAIAIIFFNNGDGSFTESSVAQGYGNHESRPADLDGDGDIDILGKPYNWQAPRLDIWLQNGTGDPSLPIDQWERHLIDPGFSDNAIFVMAADLNNDNQTDLAAGKYWYENPGKLDGQWTRHTIGNPLNNVFLLHDLDNDGDNDIVGTQGIGSASNHNFAWARNDGQGNFTILTNVNTGGSGDFLQGVTIEDFGLGHQIVLSWHNGGGGIHALTVPTNPSTTTWQFATLNTTTQGEDLSPGDIDRDGDLDLLLGTIWLRNGIAPPSEFTIGTIADLDSDAEPDRNDLADINQDGRLDAVVGFENGTHVVWFEAPADPTQSWTRHIVGNVAGEGFSMDVADFDRDGDPDIVIGEHRGTTSNRVIIFQNQGQGQSWNTVVIDTDSTNNIDHHDGTQVIDLDHDGDLDIISIGWYNKKVWIYENKAIDNQSSGASLIDQHLFYNNSVYDDYAAGHDANDDAAIASDKSALLPGQQPTFANYSSYDKGINGIMIDIENLPSTPFVNDFEFRVGRSSDSSTWDIAPAPNQISVRQNAGTNASDRITITWPDGSIYNTWLKVTIKPTANTGLATSHSFFFGSAIGDTGNNQDNTIVNATDIVGCRNNQRSFASAATISNQHDFNRDLKVDATDEIIARNHITTFITALPLKPID